MLVLVMVRRTLSLMLIVANFFADAGTFIVVLLLWLLGAAVMSWMRNGGRFGRR